MIGQSWSAIEPRKKRWVALGGIALTLIGVVALFSRHESAKQSVNRRDTVKHILTDASTREVSMDALSADMKRLSHANDSLKREVRQLHQALDNYRKKTEPPALQQDVQRLRQEVAALSEQASERAVSVQSAHAGRDDVTPGASTSSSSSLETLTTGNPATFFREASQPDTSGAQNTRHQSAPSSGMRIVTTAAPAAAAPKRATRNADAASLYLSSGALLTGVLLNGMDAPTAQGARHDPFPATLRIQKEAILPNRFRADVRECFLIVSGYGDLSSERAYLRGETLSCVREDGKVLEAQLDSYAVGEDGKAGVRGRLVSKQGQVIAKSLMAGFLSGVADAFTTDPLPIISLDAAGQLSGIFSNETLQGAAAKGAGSALERIAQFYIEMAEGMFPVIEVDAGRQVDVIVTRGTALKIQSPGAQS